MSTVVGTRQVPVNIGMATQGSSEHEINQLNLAMRSTPWYQEWFAQQGLNPNRVKLNERQRASLAAIANQHGYQLGDRMKIDEAGNINQKGGFAGMPTWAKVAISAAPIAGSMLIPGVREATIGQLSGIFGGGGGLSASTGAAAATEAGIFGTPAAMASNASWLGPLAGGAGGGGGAAATGIGMRQILQSAITPTIGAASNYFSNRAASNSARDAAELEVSSLDRQMDFMERQEEQRRREHEATEQRNYGIYTDERDYTRRLEAEKQARQEPYRRFHLANLGQLSQPMRNIRQRA